MPVEAVALVSLGRHPVSLRPRLAYLDARALALARAAGAAVTALYVGPPETGEAVLRASLGLGAARAMLIPTAPRADPLPALLAWLRAHPHPVVVAGERAETGEGSGMVPFIVAESLGCALVARGVGLEVAASGFSALQALPGGRRRILAGEGPLVLVAGDSAPPAPLGAAGPARRSRIELLPAAEPAEDALHVWPRQPARKRPRRLLPGGPQASGTRQQLSGADPVAAADAILEFLARESLLAPPSAQQKRP